MNKKILLISSGVIIVTIFFIIAYISFNILGIPLADAKKYQITIATENVEKIYDGEVLESDTWWIESGSLVFGHHIEYVMNSQITEPGSIVNQIGIAIYDNEGMNVTDNYDITYDLGNLIVYGIPLTIKTESEEKYYDGLTLENYNYTLTQGSLLSGDRLVSTMNTSITNPGSEENEIYVIIYDAYGQNVTNHYDITFDLGVLTIYAIPLTIQTDSAEKTFDGTYLSNPSWHLKSGTLLRGNTMSYEMNAKLLYPGSISNDIGITILNAKNEDVTHIYDITYELGTLTIRAIELSIQTSTASKVYDGQILTDPTYTILSGSVLEQDRFTYTMEASILNPGSVDNQIGITIYNALGEDITFVYHITYDIGTLTIYTLSITISTDSAMKTYDGTPLTSDGWALTKGYISTTNHIVANMNSSITSPGSVLNQIDVTILDDQGSDVTSNYNITYKLGTLTINPIEIAVFTETASKVYDGSALTSDVWGLLSGSILDNNQVNVVMNSSITAPGTIANEAYLTILNDQNQDVTTNYIITYHYGTLTIHPMSVIIKSGSASKVYDGTPLSNSDWGIVYGSILDTHELYVSVDAEITDIGSIDNDIFVYVLDQDGQNVTNYYQFSFDTGTLTILSGVNSSGTISNESFPLTNTDVFKFYTSLSGMVYFRDVSYEGYNMTGWNLDINNEANITTNPLNFASQSLEDLGGVSNDIQIEYLLDQMPYLLPYFSNATLSGINDFHIYGDTTQPVSLTYVPYSYQSGDYLLFKNTLASDDELIYREYVYSHYLDIPQSTLDVMLQLASENGLSTDSTTLISDVQRYIQNAAVYNLNFAKIPDSVTDIAVYFLTVSKEGICQHYATAAALMYRALGIPARYVTGFVGNATENAWTTVTTELAHAWVEIYIDGFGWMPIEVTGGGPVGEANAIGELTITPASVKEMYVDGITIRPDTLIISGFNEFAQLGYTYDVSFSGELSIPGITESSIASFTVYDPDGKDVTASFHILYGNGILQLYQYEITLMTSSDMKIYDGISLTNENYTIDGNLEVGHSIYQVTFIGSQTNVGLSKNKATIIIHDEQGNDVTYLYKINNVYGDLMVTPRSITITSGSATKVFDNTELTYNDYEITEGSLVLSETIVVDIIGSQLTIGKSVNLIDSIHIYSDGVDVTNNYIINIIEGELSVTPS